MQRFGLVMWLLTPFALAGVLWATIDTSPSQPNASVVESATRVVRAAVEELVYPESLPQGFIVVVKDKAGRAGNDSPIYIASNRSGWDPGHINWKMERRSDMRWQFKVPPHPEGLRMEFKFARGNWDTCEVDPDLADISNRQFPKIDISGLDAGELPVIELEIEHWADERPDSMVGARVGRYRAIEVAGGSLARLEVVGGGGDAPKLSRDALVWLPEGYGRPENASRRYPVLYMMDGQHCFESIGGTAEWKIDETASRLIGAGQVEPMIVVAIPNRGAARSSEYSPIAFADGVEPDADGFLEFLMGEVMPRVESAFRVKTGPRNTAIGGASLGGVIALYAGGRHPDVFGRVLAESVPFGYADGVFDELFRGTDLSYPPVVYLGMSERESADDAEMSRTAVERVKAFGAFLEKDRGVQRVEVVVGAGTHNEDAWGERFPQAIEFLYGRGSN